MESPSERLSDGMADNLATRLPHEVGEHPRRKVTVGAGAGERFSLDEFFARVCEREGTDLPQAAFHFEARSQGRMPGNRAGCGAGGDLPRPIPASPLRGDDAPTARSGVGAPS